MKTLLAIIPPPHEKIPMVNTSLVKKSRLHKFNERRHMQGIDASGQRIGWGILKMIHGEISVKIFSLKQLFKYCFKDLTQRLTVRVREDSVRPKYF